MNTTLKATILLVLSISLLIGATGCSPENEEMMQTQIKTTNHNTAIKAQAKIWQTVTVNYYNFEGGFYGLVTSTGGKLLPMNLAKEYQVPGTVLKIKGEMIKDMITIQQWGQPYQISDVELITLGNVENQNTF
jgi:hypothetical protein